jgi:fatty acid desaturase
MEAISEPDAFQGEIPHRLPKETLRELSRVHPWRGLAHVAAELGAIAAAIWVSSTYWHPALYLLAVIWIGARQHALAILMHDGAHYRLHPNKRVNDVVGELLLAWPLLITLRKYRASHFAHHRTPNTQEDPDWTRKMKAEREWLFPMKGLLLARLLLGDMIGLGARRLVMDMTFLSKQSSEGQRQPGSAKAFVAARVGVYAAAAIVFTVFHGWTGFLMYWVVPLLTWLVMVLRLRSIAEHFAIEHDHPYTEARTTFPSLLERLLIAPKNVNYHLEHHLYPSVPFYLLPKLHASLMEVEQYRTKAHLTQSYAGVLKECLVEQKAGAAEGRR